MLIGFVHCWNCHVSEKTFIIGFKKVRPITDLFFISSCQHLSEIQIQPSHKHSNYFGKLVVVHRDIILQSKAYFLVSFKISKELLPHPEMG